MHDRISDMVAPKGILADVRSKIDAGRIRADINYWSL